MSPAKLPTRKLGRDGPEIPAIGFGLMGLSAVYGNPPTEQEVFAILDRAWDIGATFWDTAAMYGNNEETVGKWFALHPERRSDVFLATKFGVDVEVVNGQPNMKLDSSPEGCKASCERSLRALQTEYIDIFYVHRFDFVTPVEETMAALVELKKEGKIKHIGFSECSSDTVRRGHAVHPLSAVQIEYNPWTLDIETESGTHLLETCRQLGISIVTYSPLGRGLLMDRHSSTSDLAPSDLRHMMPRFAAQNFEKNQKLRKVFSDMAEKKGCSTAQVVIGWIMAQGDDFIPIPGTKSIKYLEQNIKAVDVKVTPEEEKMLRAAIDLIGGPAGARAPDAERAYADTPPLVK